ncbi:hypothetical protein PC129_g18813 [Phytophthora cactorum]|uniref:Uncharacterized protein n=1 Tax=Phytophthora cactorum TaxID=29920 RepID=A0A8T1BHE7_9STRA|nr:hypothetical protein Pcac1_g12380 [Phytophthora cactorum]KAG2883087.1 hypothetical protein PC114_g20736 [Phytophthora cactorum]KAG2901683.1 hypothetical protein PC117_g21661 [Phytophthora cactorum]KAG2982380.1 hypothetical protein PC119_g20850 [Phytophthora cactorum]KAG2998896.1 hypothetical protein PC120_g21030 [Phytophthora cactorum]
MFGYEGATDVHMEEPACMADAPVQIPPYSGEEEGHPTVPSELTMVSGDSTRL